MILKELPSEQKPREKALVKGIDSLSDAELLAILLRSGYRGKSAIEVGYELLSKYDGLTGIANTSIHQLVKTKGLGKAKSLSLLAAIEFAKRINYKPYELTKFSGPEEIYKYFEPKLGLLEQEKCAVIYFNARGKVTKIDELFKGGLEYHVVHYRDIFREAVKNNARYLILLHNHPSGDPTPSDDDVERSIEIDKIGRKLGINLLDHIIISKGSFCSMKSNKLF